MIHRRRGPWDGPECPWCGGEMIKSGVDGDEAIFVCKLEHSVRAPLEDEEPSGQEAIEMGWYE